ncbi:MAG: PP2C family protein-serine/threonine phosphatase, partial [Planctomycetota bacterium]
IRASMSVPLLAGEDFIGALHIDSQSLRQAFDERDLELLSAIGRQAALSIENRRLYEALKEKARLEHELHLASEIQQGVFPDAVAPREDIDVYGLSRPAKEVGGDYFDFIETPGGDLTVAVGDVSGKGLNAGLVMMMARSLLRPLARTSHPLLEILVEMNRDLIEDTKPWIFMTFLLLRWLREEGCLEIAGAGHENLVRIHGADGSLEVVPSGGMPLGITPELGKKIEVKRLPLLPGDVVFLYTDGATDAVNESGDRFGLPRLQGCLRERAGSGTRELVEGVMEDLLAFSGSTPQADDITLLAIQRKGGREGKPGGAG